MRPRALKVRGGGRQGFGLEYPNSLALTSKNMSNGLMNGNEKGAEGMSDSDLCMADELHQDGPDRKPEALRLDRHGEPQ